ncbi:MAG: hypothetical protein RLZZ507_2938 [Cyanobacteriota bacterium]|jgi:hypothetical protein
MSNYIHCPRNSVTPHSNSEQIADTELCDFCWYEYCFCWSEYCMDEWYEIQTQHKNQQLQEKTGDLQSQY